MDRPQYVNWIVREAGVVFEDQQPLNCYRLSYVIDDAILDDWALHIRRHYVPDDELEEDAALNKLTVEEYLRQYVIPQKGEPFGPTARSNDISEILFADLFEFILNYEVPRCIDNVPDSGNTPQQIASKLLKYYHLSMHSEIRVTGGDDRASVTSTTSNKPGDVNEEWCNRILKVYEITVKPFDEERIIDSYDCIEKFNQHSEQQIREVIVICRPKDCPNQIRTSGLSLYLGSIDHQNVRYYFWNIYEWVVSMLQKMPDEGKEFFLRSLNCYINDANTSEAVKIEWRKLHNIE